VSEPRVENPEHDSLVLKLDQLEMLIERADAVCGEQDFDVRQLQRIVDDMVRLTAAIRAQVLK
jgi:hypothetical protein